jgi:hypothetical protein
VKPYQFLVRISTSCFLCAAAIPAPAQLFDLAPPPETYAGRKFQGGFTNGPGDRRSFFFEDVLPFQLTSVGIDLNPNGTTMFTASLYSVVGIDSPGDLLISNSVQLPDLDRGFYSIPITRAFAGTSTRYLLDIQWSVKPQEARFYSFEGLGDGAEPISPPYIVGPVRVIDGRGGGPLNEKNFVIAHFRIDIVPEPACAVLLGVGLSFVLSGRWRKTTRS